MGVTHRAALRHGRLKLSHRRRSPRQNRQCGVVRLRRGRRITTRFGRKPTRRCRNTHGSVRNRCGQGVEPLLSKAQFADTMHEAIAPYLPTIQGMGLSPEKAVSALMQADYTLRTAPPQQKMQLFMQLAQSYGIQLPTGGQSPQQQPQAQVDPLVWQLQNELNNVRGEVMGWKQQQEMQQNQQLLSEINQFSMKADHFEEARPTMIQLLQSGMAETLDEAYEKAIRLNPDLFEQINKAQQAEVAARQAKEQNRAAKAARAAAVSVRSATPGVNTAPKAANRRALLEEAFSESESRL